MRCSSCEPLLDDYLEGTLTGRQTRAVSHHLKHCAACETFLRELRVVDALLTTARAPGSVDSDFTRAVVSATRAAAPHAVRRFPLWLPLIGYLAVAWAVVGFAATRFGDFAGIFAGIGSAAARGILAIDAALRAVTPVTLVVAAAVTGILLIDLLLFAGLIYGYRRLRPMLAVYLARSPRP